MKYNFDFIVIGAGSAGLTLASGAAGLGAKVLLIEKHKMGGDCLNTGCVPSKALLKISHGIKHSNNLNKFGINIKSETPDLKTVMDYVRASIRKIEPKDSKSRYEKIGVKVLFGDANLLSEHEVTINNSTYTGKNIVIATGSRPFIPPIDGLEDIDYLTSENVFELDVLPKKLMVIGAGPIGLELGQGFSNLGSEVHIMNRTDKIFLNDDEEVGPFMLDKLNEDLIFHMDTQILKISKMNDKVEVIVSKDGKTSVVEVDNILISTGRAPNIEGLGLEKVGILTNKRGYISTDLKMRTNIKNIYACGDISGNFGFTHMAGYEAGIVIRNSIFKFPYKADYTKVAWTTFTSPSVAHTGLTEEMAKKQGVFGSKIVLDFKGNDRFMIENEDGFIKVILDNKSRVLGATIVSEDASELLHSFSLLIQRKLKITEFMNLIIPYPMRGDILKELSIIKSKEMLTPFTKKLIKNVFLKL